MNFLQQVEGHCTRKLSAYSIRMLERMEWNYWEIKEEEIAVVYWEMRKGVETVKKVLEKWKGHAETEKKENHFFKLGWVAVIFVINVIFFITTRPKIQLLANVIWLFFLQNIRNSMFRGVWSFYIQNQFWFKLPKQYQLITITFKQVYPNIDQFTSDSLLIKINSLKLNSIKINSRHRHTKHTL